MKGVFGGIIAAIGFTLWTAFSLGACAYAVRYGWLLAG